MILDSVALMARASRVALVAALASLAMPAWAQIEEADVGEQAQVNRPQGAGEGDARLLSPASPQEQSIVVTGSRIARTGFTTPTPVTVVGAERIEAFGATNVGEVLTSFPAFRATESPATSGVQTGEGANLGARYLDLRGLGANRTLVLVDGKRFAPTSIRGLGSLWLRCRGRCGQYPTQSQSGRVEGAGSERRFPAWG